MYENSTFTPDSVEFTFYNAAGQVQIIGFGGSIKFTNQEILTVAYRGSIAVKGGKTAEGLYYQSEVIECRECEFGIGIFDAITQGKIQQLLEAVPNAYRINMIVRGYQYFNQAVGAVEKQDLQFDIGLDFDRTSFERIARTKGLERNVIKSFVCCETEVPPVPLAVPGPVIIRNPNGIIIQALAIGR